MDETNQLSERLEFLEMDAGAARTLRNLRPLLAEALGPALTRFYGKVAAAPQLSPFFRDAGHMDTAKGAQARHWGAIAEGDFGPAYAAGVRRIGETHARIGLEPRWYIGGYALVLEDLLRAVVEARYPRALGAGAAGRERMAAELGVLAKATLLDMELAISVYLEAIAAERKKAEDERREAEARQQHAIAALSEAIGRLSRGDLLARVEAEVSPEFETVKADFNAAVSTLHDTMAVVAEVMSGVRSGVEELSHAADDLARRTEQQASSLEKSAAALEELTSSVGAAADGARQAASAVGEAREDAEKSGEVVQETVSAMAQIEQSSSQISQIIGVIDEIAFQTNLLALNAGVEAARAGEAGRGFAVVASEVRALAQRSAEAAKEIKGLISASTTQVGQGVVLVGQTGEALNRIAGQVADINRLVAEISISAREQSSGLAEVNAAVNQMDQMTQQNAAMVEQSTAATHALNNQVEQLSELVRQFRVARAGETAPRRGASEYALAS